MKIVLCTGGFDPLHSGHIGYFKAARTLGDMLIVGLNSDEWLERKKGRAFMPWNERLCIINNLAMVDEVYTFDDSDGSAKHFIQQVRAHYPDADLVFANGGDRTPDNIPEMDVVDARLEFVFGVGGGNKANSSSWILEEWKAPKTQRPWGYYRVLHEAPGIKVKELTLVPGKSISYQKHNHRSEFWLVSEGTASVLLADPGETDFAQHTLERHDGFIVSQGYWHKITNPTLAPLQIVEIQFGELCEEEDIQRKTLDTN